MKAEVDVAVDAEVEIDEARLLAEAGVGRGEASAEAAGTSQAVEAPTAEAAAEATAKAATDATEMGQAEATAVAVAVAVEATGAAALGQATEVKSHGETAKQASALGAAAGPLEGTPPSPGDGNFGLPYTWHVAWWSEFEQASAQSLLSHSAARDHTAQAQKGGRQQGAREGSSSSKISNSRSPYALSRVLRCTAVCGHAPSPAWL